MLYARINLCLAFPHRHGVVGETAPSNPGFMGEVAEDGGVRLAAA